MPAEFRDPQTYAIIGAAMEVHREMKHGFLEHAYREAMAFEMALRGIPFAKEVKLPLFYKGHQLDCSYRADFICFDKVIVEAKALKALSNIERAQVINYLKVTGFGKALLLNFGSPRLEYERFAN